MQLLHVDLTLANEIEVQRLIVRDQKTGEFGTGACDPAARGQ
jgi:hypothetical protein